MSCSRIASMFWTACVLISMSATFAPGMETLETRDGRRIRGTLGGQNRDGFLFLPQQGGPPILLTSAHRVLFEPETTTDATPRPNFLFRIGLGGQFSGRLDQIAGDAVTLTATASRDTIRVARPGILGVMQPPGEAVVLLDPFECLDSAHWRLSGHPELSADAPHEGASSLLMAAGTNAIDSKLREPVQSGRLDLAFQIRGEGADVGRRAYVELSFRTPTGLVPLRVMLDSHEPTYGFSAPDRQFHFAVQSLRRDANWQRLAIRFGPESVDASVEGRELAHGDGEPGPLEAIRVATEGTGSTSTASRALAIDDLRLVRFVQPSSPIESDPNQDALELAFGDQLFGTVESGDSREILFRLADQRSRVVHWLEVTQIALRREQAASESIVGDWVQLTWINGITGHPDSVEGALHEITEDQVILQVPYVGMLSVPRRRIETMNILGHMRRMILDAGVHHLGQTFAPELEPRYPEGSVLEIWFDLKSLARVPRRLTIDEIRVSSGEGEATSDGGVNSPDPTCSASLNSQRLGHPESDASCSGRPVSRFRLSIPDGALRVGRNGLKLEPIGISGDHARVNELGVQGIAIEEDFLGPEMKASQP